MNKNIKTQYNNFSVTYSQNLEVQNELSNTMFHRIFDFDVTNKKILDVGCGDGTDLKKIADQGAIPYGIDPSEEFVQMAKNINKNGVIRKGIGEDVPFSDNFFDIVVSKWAIQTSPDVKKIFSEIARVLKKDGIFIALIKHPWMQQLEKVRDYGNNADYYEQKIVTSNIYEGKIVLKEPSHTIGDYFNKDFFENFELLDYQEATDFPASEQINNGIYPTFFIIKTRRK